MSGICWALGGTELVRVRRHFQEGEVGVAVSSKGHRGHRKVVKAAPLQPPWLPFGCLSASPRALLSLRSRRERNRVCLSPLPSPAAWTSPPPPFPPFPPPARTSSAAWHSPPLSGLGCSTMDTGLARGSQASRGLCCYYWALMRSGELVSGLGE